MKFTTPLLFAATAAAHFTITDPGSIGFDDDKESEDPCGGFDVTSRTNVSDYPAGGRSFTLLTTHAAATWTFKAALLSNTDDFQYLSAPVTQSGVGTFCLPNIPGPAAWAGQDGVVQVSQAATDGSLYQCVAVTFTSGDAADVPSVCTNSSGTSAEWSTLPSGAVLAGSNSTSSNSTSTSTATASSSSATGAAGHVTASIGSAALMAAAAYLL